MKLKNIIFLVLIIVFIIISLPIICWFQRLLSYDRQPVHFPGTTYATEDGSIWFNVYEEETVFVDDPRYWGGGRSNMIGQITKDGKIYDFFIEIGEDGSLMFISTEIAENYDYDMEYTYNYLNNFLLGGEVSYKSEKHFILTVTENWVNPGGLYELGTVLEFFRNDAKE